jgi:hypothetical protein
MTQNTWGRWLRVSTSVKAEGQDELVNLDNITRVVPMSSGNSRFYFTDGTHLDTVDSFELMACALMVSEGPQPPLTREEVARSEYEPPALHDLAKVLGSYRGSIGGAGL